MDSIFQFMNGVNWDSPGPVAVIILLTILAIMRKWYLVTLLMLIITLGRGLGYLHLNRELLSSHLTSVTLVYLVGGMLMTVIAAVEFFVKE